MDKIHTILGDVKRNKYERQRPFQIRANQWFRNKVKSMYQHKFTGKETAVIIKYPLDDLEGKNILTYQLNHKTNFNQKVKWLYLKLKMRFEQ